MVDIIYKEESYRIIGVAINVHKKLGAGFLENVYQEALQIELQNQEIPFQKEKKLAVIYDDKPLNKFYRADFVCFNRIIVELKAQRFISNHDIAQTLNYLKATNFKLGLLINFGSPSLTYKRVLNCFV